MYSFRLRKPPAPAPAPFVVSGCGREELNGDYGVDVEGAGDASGQTWRKELPEDPAFEALHGSGLSIFVFQQGANWCVPISATYI
jgi:hypothetical protein